MDKRLIEQQISEAVAAGNTVSIDADTYKQLQTVAGTALNLTILTGIALISPSSSILEKLAKEAAVAAALLAKMDRSHFHSPTPEEREKLLREMEDD